MLLQLLLPDRVLLSCWPESGSPDGHVFPQCLQMSWQSHLILACVVASVFRFLDVCGLPLPASFSPLASRTWHDGLFSGFCFVLFPLLCWFAALGHAASFSCLRPHRPCVCSFCRAVLLDSGMFNHNVIAVNIQYEFDRVQGTPARPFVRLFRPLFVLSIVKWFCNIYTLHGISFI